MPSQTSTDAYAELIDRTREAHLLSSTASLLGWDQETLMPRGAVPLRSRQQAQLARMTHEMRTHPRVGELIAACEADAELTSDATSPSAVNLRELRRGYDRATRLPTDLVAALSEASSESKAVWAEAKRTSDFALFAPALERTMTLKREAAACYGWAEDGEPWDALADQFEPGCTAREIEAVFVPLRTRLVALIERLTAGATRPSDAIDDIRVPIPAQEAFCKMLVARLGFDFDRGRLDTSSHPFCSGRHHLDVRMTTRFAEDRFSYALKSSMHETGHGIYNQSLDPEHAGTPMGQSISLGIHESQSRMVENHVGRSAQFWRWCLPQLKAHLGAAASALTFDDCYGGVNRVRPGLIRVESDEATYNLHIMLRFELERALISGDLAPRDIPSAWNDKVREYLGIDVPDDAHGCLQDIHWAMGLVGYFPTYTLGNLHAAQMFETAREQIPGLEDGFAAGEFEPLKRWLNEKIHRQGMRYSAARLCEVVTGAPLSPEPLMRHLEGKFSPLYGV